MTSAFRDSKYFLFPIPSRLVSGYAFEIPNLLGMFTITRGGDPMGMKSRIVWAGLGGAVVAALVPMAWAHADDLIPDLNGLSLVSAGHDVPNTALGPDGYVGFQPYFTEWQQDQPTDVEINGSTAGSYDVSETDYATPWTDESNYDFGTATSGGTDPGGLAGATVTDFALYPSFNAASEERPPLDVTADLHDLHAVFADGVQDNILTTGLGSFLSEDAPGIGSALWFEAPGSTDPTELFSALPDTSAALSALEDLSSLLPPDVWFPGI
jgi:hypothetical protein